MWMVLRSVQVNRVKASAAALMWPWHQLPSARILARFALQAQHKTKRNKEETTQQTSRQQIKAPLSKRVAVPQEVAHCECETSLILISTRLQRSVLPNTS